MRRETQNILLVLLGGALLKIALNGTYLNYVKPGLQPWLIVSGAVMVVLAGVAIATDILKARRAARAAETASGAAAGVAVAEHDHSHGGGHGHSHGAARSAWMLLMPVLAIFLIAPPALGADSVNRAGGRTVASEQRQDQVIKTKFPPLPAGSVVPMRMADVATRAAWDATNSLNGRTLELTGFVVHDAAGVYVARLVITCCAADAETNEIDVVSAGSPPTTGRWVSVIGRVDATTPGNRFVAILRATDVQAVPRPANPYG